MLSLVAECRPDLSLHMYLTKEKEQLSVKGTVQRDFLPPNFFIIRASLGYSLTYVCVKIFSILVKF